MSELIYPDLTQTDAIQAVWEKGIKIDGYDSALYRHDYAGAWIARNAYGDRNNIYGWEIDHVYPESFNGDNHLDNLRPMHWKNNLSKGDDYPHYTAVLIAEGNHNIEKESLCTVGAKTRERIKELFHTQD